MTKQELKTLRSKIEQGLQLAYKRLLAEKQKENGDLIVSHNGKITRIKARDIREK